ncbi:MAG TPA: tautomerase family protein [Pseudolabrys sp.]|jgi:4-oxalocrotonate tautomerase
MPEIHVYLAAGRSDEVKKNLMLDITHAVTKNCEVSADVVTVQIMESALTEKMKGGLTFLERKNQAAQKK